MTHRRDIEGLRALAVLAVVLYHLGVPGFGGGFVGVDIFFVISGFLITSLLIDERTSTGHVEFLGFYARRARRLLPISALVLALTAISAIVWLPATRLADIAADIRAAALFGANLLFAQRGTDYLTATLDPSPLQHYWSLAVEEQFYFLWPALIALVTIGAAGSTAIRRRTTVAMSVLVATSFVACVFLTSAHPAWSYFGLHTRGWELGLGALIACRRSTIAVLPARRLAIVGWTGLAAMVISVITFGSVTSFPGWAAALPVAATGAAIIGGADHVRRGPGRILRAAGLQVIGARSYSLYLWHWPVLIVAEGHLLRSLHVTEKMLAMALIVLLSELGYRYVENPVRRSRPLAARPGFSTALGGALVCVGLLSGMALSSGRGGPSTGILADAPDIGITSPADTGTTPVPTTSDDHPTPSGPDESLGPADPTTDAPTVPRPIVTRDLPALAAVVAALATDIAPDNLRPALGSAKGDTPPIYASGCHQFQATAARTDCVYGDADGDVTIALWGDSHAAQWFTPLEAIATTNGWRLLSLTQGSCSFLDVTVYDRVNNREFGNCTPWRSSVREILLAQGVDVVVLSQHYGLLDAATDAPISPTRWTHELPLLIQSLRADGIEPVLIGDTPNPDTTVPDCIAERSHHISHCAAAQYDGDDAGIVEAIRDVTTATATGFVEPGEWLCADDGRCPAIIGDILVYRDGNHISETAAEWLSPLVDSVVVPFLLALVSTSAE